VVVVELVREAKDFCFCWERVSIPRDVEHKVVAMANLIAFIFAFCLLAVMVLFLSSN